MTAWIYTSAQVSKGKSINHELNSLVWDIYTYLINVSISMYVPYIYIYSSSAQVAILERVQSGWLLTTTHVLSAAPKIFQLKIKIKIAKSHRLLR